MGLAIIIGKSKTIPREVADALLRLGLEAVFVEIPAEKSRYRSDAIQPFVEAIQELGKALDGLNAVVSLADSSEIDVLAKAARSALIKLTLFDPIMVSWRRERLVVVKGGDPYPIPER